MLKRMLSALLIPVLSLSLFGCGAAEPAQTTTAPETTAATEPAPSGPSQAAIDALDGKKIIFIGNSYTYWGNCVIKTEGSVATQEERSNDKGLFYQLCKENGIDVSVTNWTFGSHNLTDTMGSQCMCEGKACEGTDHTSYLTDPVFDYVALQCFYETEYTGDLLSHLQPAMDFFRAANPNVKFLLLVPHMTYVRDFCWKDDLDALTETEILVCNWGGMLNDIVNKTVTVPGATQEYYKASFVISRNEDDGHHQNMLAGYLTALMAYCAITGESAVGQPYAFCDDYTIHPNFDMDTFQTKNYTYDTFTNFVEIYRSEADMQGLQQLTDEYLAKYNK